MGTDSLYPDSVLSWKHERVAQIFFGLQPKCNEGKVYMPQPHARSRLLSNQPSRNGMVQVRDEAMAGGSQVHCVYRKLVWASGHHPAGHWARLCKVVSFIPMFTYAQISKRKSALQTLVWRGKVFHILAGVVLLHGETMGAPLQMGASPA